MNNFEEVTKAIVQHIPDADVYISDLTGTGDHLGIHVSSKQFAGKSLIQQHQLVMDALSNLLKSQIHAVKIKTTTL